MSSFLLKKPPQYYAAAFFRLGLVSYFYFFVNADLLAVLTHTLETDTAVLQSIESVIVAAANIQAGMDSSAALLYDDVAGQNELTVSALNARRLDSESRPFLVEPTPFL